MVELLEINFAELQYDKTIGNQIGTSKNVAFVSSCLEDGGVEFHGTWRGKSIVIQKFSGATDASFKRSKAVDEVKSLNMVNKHPYILRYIGVADEGGALLTVAEASLSTVRKYLDDQAGKLDVGQGLKMMQQIACGLAHLHGNKVVHGCLRAANVLRNNDVVLIANFGLKYIKECNAKALKLTYTTASSLGWCSPECLLNRSQDACTEKSDVYAFGVTAYVRIVGITVMW